MRWFQKRSRNAVGRVADLILSRHATVQCGPKFEFETNLTN